VKTRSGPEAVIGQLDVHAGVVLREAHHLASVIDPYRQLGQEPIGDPTLIQHFDRARMKTAGPRADEHVIGTPLDDRNVDLRQRQLGRQHHPRRATSSDHHDMICHMPPSFPVRSGFGPRFCAPIRTLLQATGARCVDDGGSRQAGDAARSPLPITKRLTHSTGAGRPRRERRQLAPLKYRRNASPEEMNLKDYTLAKRGVESVNA